jgi:hypothetical protein
VQQKTRIWRRGGIERRGEVGRDRGGARRERGREGERERGREGERERGREHEGGFETR